MVVVVGASSSGLETALQLARAGEKVLLLEGGDGPSVKRRLIVTPTLLRLLPLPKEMILSVVHAYEFVTPGCGAVIPLKEPDLVIERQGLIEMLLREAVSAGVQVRQGWRFTGFCQGQALFESPRGEDGISFRWLVGADGARSSVAKALGMELQVVHLLQVHVHLPPDLPEGVSRIWLRPDLTPYFLWLFPDSPREGVLGVIARSGDEAQRALEEVLAEQGLDPRGYEAGVVSLFSPSFRPRQGKVLLVGDAAGQVKVTTVGGTVTGLRGGRACARGILRGRDYLEEVRGLWRELVLHHWIRKVLDRMAPHHYTRLLEVFGQGGTLGAFSRDELTRNLPLLPLRAPFATLRGLSIMLSAFLGR